MIAEEDAASYTVSWDWEEDAMDVRFGRRERITYGTACKKEIFLFLPLLMQCLLTSLFCSSFSSFPFSLFTYS